MSTQTSRKRARKPAPPRARRKSTGGRARRTSTRGRVAQDPVRELWLAGLGAAATTGEVAGRALDLLVERGREREPQLRAETERVVAEARAKAVELGGAVERRARKVIDQVIEDASRRLGIEKGSRKNLLHRLGDLAEAIL
jgi:polyhydroxyalkanoate synthesis regulator phasin